MVSILLLFSQTHREFRLPEFRSVCRLHGIELSEEKCAAISQEYLQIISFSCIDDVLKILSRSLLLKSAYEVFAEDVSHEKLIEFMRKNVDLLDRFNEVSSSWALRFASHGQKRRDAYRSSVLERYADFMDLNKSAINLRNPTNAFYVVEKCDKVGVQQVYFCRHVGDGSGKLKTLYDIKKRKYIGNSTMDPELAFIQSNLALCAPQTLILDPFCGTGGIMLAASHFGSLSMGMEIDYQVARAVGKSSRSGETRLRDDHSIRANFQHYGIEARFVGVLLADSSRNAIWHVDGLFDAILTDPPYGIREKGQRLGFGDEKRGGEPTTDSITTTDDGSTHRYPKKTAYAISNVYLGLIDSAVRLLRVGGRLCFWFPILRNEYNENVLPRHDCFHLLYNCEQILTREASRRLLVYEKLKDNDTGKCAFFVVDCYKSESFRSKIFIGNLQSST